MAVNGECSKLSQNGGFTLSGSHMVKAIRAPKAICLAMKKTIPMWDTTFTAGKGVLAISFELQLERGIFQGDLLLPLLFCCAIVP